MIGGVIMYGAILGDIMSNFQKSENDGIFYLIEPKFKFTDYTVMTTIIADALLSIKNNEELNEDKIKNNIKKSWTKFYNKYSNPAYDAKSTAAIISAIPYIYNYEQIVEVTEMVASIINADAQNINEAQTAAIAIYYDKITG